MVVVVVVVGADEADEVLGEGGEGDGRASRMTDVFVGEVSRRCERRRIE